MHSEKLSLRIRSYPSKCIFHIIKLTTIPNIALISKDLP